MVLHSLVKKWPAPDLMSERKVKAFLKAIK